MLDFINFNLNNNNLIVIREKNTAAFGLLSIIQSVAECVIHFGR